jgi:hypothetical protein
MARHMDLSALQRFIEEYPDKPFLVRAVLIGGGALLGILNLVHGLVVAPQIEASVNKFNWYLGNLILSAGLMMWPPIVFLYGDATNTIALVMGAAVTVALGAFLSGRARRNERFVSED